MFFVCHLHDISQANETAEPEISVMTSPEKQPEPGWDITPHYRFAQAFESPSSMTQWAECGGGKRSPSPLVSRWSLRKLLPTESRSPQYISYQSQPVH